MHSDAPCATLGRVRWCLRAYENTYGGSGERCGVRPRSERGDYSQCVHGRSGNVTVANQPAKTDNSSPALRWRVAASPGGRLRWTFSTGKGRWGDNPVHALAVARDGVLYAGVGTSVEAILVVSSQK